MTDDDDGTYMPGRDPDPMTAGEWAIVGGLIGACVAFVAAVRRPAAMGGGKPSPWKTPGVQQALEACLGKGFTASETARFIYRKFNVYVSRRAIIGRAYRTGVQLRSKGGNDVHIPPTPKGIRGGRPKTFVASAVVELRVTPDEPKPRGDVDSGCRWITGEATARNFCGHGTWPLTPWCDYHARRVWNGPATVKSNARAALAEVA